MRASFALPAALAVALLSLTAPAREPVPRKVQDLIKDMMTDYNTGDFQGALAKATEAYRLRPLPALLFNMGQFHKELGHWERAEFFFKRYLNEKPDAGNRALVEKLIGEMDAKQSAPAPSPPSQPNPPPPGPGEAAAAGGAPPPSNANARALPSAREEGQRGAATTTAGGAPNAAAPSPAAVAAATSTSIETPHERSHVAAFALIAGGGLLAVGAGLATIPIFGLGSVNSQIQSGRPGLSWSQAQNAQSNARTFEGVSIGLGIAALACFSAIAFVW